MKKSFKIILFLSVLVLAAAFFSPKLYLKKSENFNTPASNKNEGNLINLTLEQKIGQLLIIGFEGKEITSELENLLKTVHPGGVILLSRNIENAEQLKKIINGLQEISIKDTGLPLFIAVDQEGGQISRIDFLKEKTAQFEIKNEEQAFEVGFNRSQELKELGVNLNFAPVLDIVEPDDFLYSRSFQKSTKETGELGGALVSGQKAAGIFTAIKHFPGYGGISFNPEREELPLLNKIPEISQFKEVLIFGPEMVMTANVVYEKMDKDFPFTLSLKGIQFLKKQLGDDFLIISDDLSSPVLKQEFSLKGTVISALKAGAEILIVAGFDEPRDVLSAFNFLFEAAEKGEIPEEIVGQAVSKIIKLKQKLLK